MPDEQYKVHPEGDLDIATVPALRDQWLRAIDQQQPRLFVVDLSAVTYLDSTSLAALVAVRRRQREHGGEVIVVNATPRLAKIFHITGLNVFLHLNGQDDEDAVPDGRGDGLRLAEG